MKLIQSKKRRDDAFQFGFGKGRPEILIRLCMIVDWFLRIYGFAGAVETQNNDSEENKRNTMSLI